MRDDQRPAPHNHGDDQDDPWDDALDELFGPDEDELETRPRPSRQTPQAAGGNNPPPRVYEPDEDHHRTDGDHVLGAENQAPPSSYADDAGTASAATDTMAIAPERASGPAAKRAATRDWRKIACFGCLAITGIPALCLGALVVLGLISDAQDGEQAEPAGGVFVDNLTPTSDEAIANVPTVAQQPASSGSPDFYQELMDGREQILIELNGESGFGTINKPVPIGVSGPVGGGWDLRVNSVDPDANQTILDANMFNEPPAAERQFVVANITATNGTGQSEMFDASYRLRLVGTATGTVYTTFEVVDRCGVIPEPVEDVEIAHGDSISGNVCWQVLQEDLQSLILFNEEFLERDLAIWFDATAGNGSVAS